MRWYDDAIAGPMGYERCVLFDCARDALAAHLEVTEFVLGLPENICPEVAKAASIKTLGPILEPIDQQTGLADLPVHLYGYQAEHSAYARLSLDPLMTGWVRHLKTPSAVISFGLKKMVSIGYGGAFLTNDQFLADEMEEKGHWNDNFTDFLRASLAGLATKRILRFETFGWWDRYLADSLYRIPGEQLMPWRVMRRARDWHQRENIKIALRDAGYDVGTNYRPLSGTNLWGDTVLNFFCSPDITRGEIFDACEIIKRAVNNG